MERSAAKSCDLITIELIFIPLLHLMRLKLMAKFMWAVSEKDLLSVVSSSQVAVKVAAMES